MISFFTGLGITILAVAYGAGMFYLGLILGVEAMKRNPDEPELTRHDDADLI